MICIICSEEIKAHEVIPDAEGKAHHECLFRSVAGSVAHQTGKCSCYGGVGEDDPNLTVRENAKASLDYFRLTQEKAAKAKFN